METVTAEQALAGRAPEGGEPPAPPPRAGLAFLRRQRTLTLLAAFLLEAALILPMSVLPATATLGLPAAVGVSVAAVAGILIGPWEGALIALLGAALFVVFVSEFQPGGFAALAVWPALTLAVALLVHRSWRHRERLQVALAEANERLRALLGAGIALNSQLALEAVLQRLVEAAATLTGARYAALGLIDRTGSGLEHFIFTGLDAEVAAEIGALPGGRGVLGILIRDPQPLRLRDVAEHPDATGFPPGHPPMRSFLGVPILLRGVAYGNLYLTEKAAGEEFTVADEELVSVLAAQAAVAIENARLYESSNRWLRQLESLNEISSGLTGELELSRLLALIARNLRELVAARVVLIELPTPDGGLRIEAADGEGSEGLVGLRLDPRGSKGGRVLERRRSERIDSLVDDPEVDEVAARKLGGVAGLYVPLLVGERAIGVVACHDKLGSDGLFTHDDLRLAEAFALRAAVAVDLSERVARSTLRSILEAQELERRRLARELHDETGQALTAILLGLRPVEVRASPEAREDIGALRELVVDTLRDVRRLAVELRPKVLDDYGLKPALERLAAELNAQSGIEVELDLGIPEGERLPSELETAVYRIVQEALTNVFKHAHARHVSIRLVRWAESVTVAVEDDGRGFELAGVDPERLGLVGMRERVSLLGGRLAVEGRPGSGARIAVELPLVGAGDAGREGRNRRARRGG